MTRKFIAPIIMLVALAGCTPSDMMDEMPQRPRRIFHAGFEGDSRTYLDGELRLRWTAGDAVSIFAGETLNGEYLFAGETGDNSGDFEEVQTPMGASESLAGHYAIYPYDPQTTISSNGVITYQWPATQNYASETVGLGANVMVAATADIDDYELIFRNVGSFLRLKLWGAQQRVGSITIEGHNGEILAGEAQIMPVYGGVPTSKMVGQTTQVTLDCGSEGVLVSDTKDAPTDFWIVLPEVTFSQGFTVRVNGVYGGQSVCVVNSEVAFKRNVYMGLTSEIKGLETTPITAGNPFSSVKFLQSKNTGKMLKSSKFISASSNQYYTNGETSYDITCTYNAEEGVWEGEIPYLYDFNNLVASFTTVNSNVKVTVDGVEQTSGVTANDFNTVVRYSVTSTNGVRQEAKVRLHNTGIPIVVVEGEVYPKSTDFDDIASTAKIWFDGVEHSGAIRLRGNSTQEFPKKPYAIKLDKKAEVLGMPKHKRWVLLANWLDRTMLRNDLAFYLARQTGAWAPRGKSVELVLNGVHVGNYFLCEQIKIDKNRVNIADVGMADLSEQTEAAVAAEMGFLLECDEATDATEIYFQATTPVKFYVYIKDPGDVADLGNGVNTTVGYTYIKKYFTQIGTALQRSNWATVAELIDYQSFADHWMFSELTVNQESKHPKSFYMHKEAGGKIKAGPAWDYDWATFIAMDKFNKAGYRYQTGTAGKIQNYFTMRYTMWYTYLFNDPAFKAVIKERWPIHKAKFQTALEYLDQQAALVKASDVHNWAMWPLKGKYPNIGFPNTDETLSFDAAVAQMRTNLETRIKWLDTQINNL